MSDFKKLQVWQKARELTVEVYKHTQTFPRSELYGFVSQTRRSCISIGSNIAEGCGRAGETEKARFLQIALGSLSELEYQLIISRDLDYLDQESFAQFTSKIDELGKMLGALTRTVKGAKASASSQ